MTATKAEPATPKTITLGQLLDMDIPPRPLMLGSWMHEQGFAMLHASEGVGKTMLSMTIALAVAGGGEVLGWKSEGPMPVLIVDAEMHRADIQARLSILAQTVEGIDEEKARENLHLYDLIGNADDGPTLSLSDSAGQARVLAMLDKTKAKLVILDNLSTLGGMADENSAADADSLLGLVAQLKQREASVLLLHHNGKGPKTNTYRGTSKLAAPLDVRIALEPLKDAQGGGRAAFSLSFEKMRGKRGPDVKAIEATLVEAEVGPRWAVETPDPAAAVSEAVLRMLEEARSGKHNTQKELAEALEVNASTVGRQRRTAIKSGLCTEAEFRGYLQGGPDF